jgi:hypothetical protein
MAARVDVIDRRTAEELLRNSDKGFARRTACCGQRDDRECNREPEAAMGSVDQWRTLVECVLVQRDWARRLRSWALEPAVLTAIDLVDSQLDGIEQFLFQARSQDTTVEVLGDAAERTLAFHAGELRRIADTVGPVDRFVGSSNCRH